MEVISEEVNSAPSYRLTVPLSSERIWKAPFDPNSSIAWPGMRAYRRPLCAA